MLQLLLFSFFALAAADRIHVERGRMEPHCGLPSFTENLPAAEKEKVVKIWDDYKWGEDCLKKRAETKKVLASLPAAVRHKVLTERIPPFLRGASIEVRKAFEDLWKNTTIPRTEKPEKFKELAEKLLNSVQLKEFNKFHEMMQQRREKFQKKLAALSPEARAAHEKLADLREQRHRIYSNLTEGAKDELTELYKHEKFDDHDR